jgi:hypothetical protein
MMDCKNARLVLEVAHPLATELDARDKEELAGHLADCPACGPWAESEHRLDDHLGKALRAVPVPAELSRRIMDRLQVERLAWYRVRILRAALVTVVLLLAIWLSWALWWSRKPVPDWNGFGQTVDQILYTAQQVEDSFANQGVTMTAPPQFDYRNLQSFGLRDFQGQQVPYLLFLSQGTKDRPPALAEVYVLSERQFDIAETPRHLGLAEGRKTMRILRHSDPAHQNVLYLVVFPTGTPLDHFFLPEHKRA